MFKRVDIVRLLPGHDTDEYDTFRQGKMSGFVLKNIDAVVSSSNRNTPPEHCVIYYDYTMTYSLVTFPWQHLEFMRSAVIFDDSE